MSAPALPATLTPTNTRRKSYPVYKDSGVDWLGEIPTHWEVKALKYATVINPEALLEDTDADSILSYVDISNVNSSGTILGTQELRFADAPSRARRRVRHGDTIISTVRTYLRSIGYIENPTDNLVVSTGFAVLRPQSSFYPKFLWFLTQSHEFIRAVVAHSEGVGYPAISPSELGSLPVWLPSLIEQQAVAAFLDRETAGLDTLIAKKERQIELLQEKRAALIDLTVTRGPDASELLEDSGVEWLGKVPASWIVAPLYSRYTVQLGKMLNQDAVKGIAPAPYLRNTNVQWDYVDIADVVEMDFDADDRQKFALVPGDLLVCEGGAVGRTAMWRGELKECYDLLFLPTMSSAPSWPTSTAKRLRSTRSWRRCGKTSSSCGNIAPLSSQPP